MVPPLTSYVGTITKNVTAPESLLNNFQDSHNFALAPNQAMMLDNAEILIVPDLSMNPSFAALVAKNKKVKVIELSHLEGASLLPYPAENGWLNTPNNQKAEEAKTGLPAVSEATPDTTGTPSNDALYKKFDAFPAQEAKPDDMTASIDPHIWLDPERMAAIALPLAKELSKTYPAQQRTFEANAQAASKHLREEAIPAMNDMLAIPRTNLLRNKGEVIPFITGHPGYQYFLSRFNLPYNGTIMTRPNQFIGGKTLETMLKTAEKTRIRCVIADGVTPINERVTRASGAKLSTLPIEQSVSAADVPSASWVRNDYDRLLFKTTKTFGDCL